MAVGNGKKKTKTKKASAAIKMTTAEFAARHGVDARTVRKWVAAGLPHGRTGPTRGKTRMIEIEATAGDAWVSKSVHSDESGRGGRREKGEGRREKGTGGSDRTPDPEPQTLTEAFGGLDLDGTITVKRLMTHLSAAQLKRLVDAERVMKDRTERRQIERTLVPSADVELAWRQRMAQFDRALETLARRASQEAGRRLRLAKGKVKTLQQVLTEELDQTRNLLATGREE